jgi:integrase
MSGQRLFKRNRTWYGQFYENGLRIQRSTQTRDRRAAEAIVQQWERDAANPAHAAARSKTLSQALEALLKRVAEEAAAGKKSTETVRFYRQKAGHWVRLLEYPSEDTYVPLPLSALSPKHVDDFISARRSEGVAEHTIQKELVTLRAALKIARRFGWWTGTLETLMPSGFSTQYKPKKRWLTEQELQLLLQRLSPDKAARVAFIVATSANWRESELALRSDVVADTGELLIRGTKRESRFRKVPIVTPAQRALLALAQKHAQGQGDRFFLPWSNVRRDLHKACAEVGIEPCSPNDLRRTCATWLRIGGVPPDLIALVLGHSDSRMVERVYGRLEGKALGVRLLETMKDSPQTCSVFAADSVTSPVFAAFNAPPALSKTDNLVPRGGIEPPTRGFSVLCSTD